MPPNLGPEISDVIVDFDAETLERKPVERDRAIAVFKSIGNKRAARIIAGIARYRKPMFVRLCRLWCLVRLLS